MCRAVKCNICGKTTWAGCGQHIAEVRSTVPSGQWCNGHNQEEAAKPDTGTLLSRLFRR
jgi:hypothetical protein